MASGIYHLGIHSFRRCVPSPPMRGALGVQQVLRNRPSSQTPFAKPPGEEASNLTVNVLWGFFNLLIAWLLILSPFWPASNLRKTLQDTRSFLRIPRGMLIMSRDGEGLSTHSGPRAFPGGVVVRPDGGLQGGRLLRHPRLRLCLHALLLLVISLGTSAAAAQTPYRYIGGGRARARAGGPHLVVRSTPTTSKPSRKASSTLMDISTKAPASRAALRYAKKISKPAASSSSTWCRTSTSPRA